MELLAILFVVAFTTFTVFISLFVQRLIIKSIVYGVAGYGTAALMIALRMGVFS